jgi:diguanylate cyclase (GGDEF)-like protein
MAAFGLVDRDLNRIVPMAMDGPDIVPGTRLEDCWLFRNDVAAGMIAQAIREAKAVVANAVEMATPATEGMQDSPRSLTILPLTVAGEVVGAFALLAGERAYFNEEELKLLTELADDIGFAIHHIDNQARLEYLAYYDVLTGLANRSLFIDRVAQYMRSATAGGHKLALYMIDLERFRNINDSLGDAAGDTLLQLVAAWLVTNANDANLVARVGADHFAVVMPEVKHESDVVRLLERLMRRFDEHHFTLDATTLRISAKVGVALFPDDAPDAPALFKNAESALQRAKIGGERYLFYTQKLTATMLGKLTLENQLRHAFEHGEFVLHYQPKVSLETGRVTSAEALIRWNDPRTGIVMPAQFVAVLEETGLIREVGYWALHQAIADHLRLRNTGSRAIPIAVNVSPLQLRNDDFLVTLRQALEIDTRTASGLEVEITESVIMQDVLHSIATLRTIREMGVRIAIDDFGTGFSSLSYLAKLPVDSLKIDRSFIADMTVGPQGLALVSSIINLAHSLKLNVVAEGVETVEQSRLLRLLNCDEIQGFVVSPALPTAAFEQKFLTRLPPQAVRSSPNA